MTVTKDFMYATEKSADNDEHHEQPEKPDGMLFFFTIFFVIYI